jgi:hypothetical protein
LCSTQKGYLHWQSYIDISGIISDINSTYLGSLNLEIINRNNPIGYCNAQGAKVSKAIIFGIVMMIME